MSKPNSPYDQGWMDGRDSLEQKYEDLGCEHDKLQDMFFKMSTIMSEFKEEYIDSSNSETSVIGMLVAGHENYIKHLHRELDEANAHIENIDRNPCHPRRSTCMEYRRDETIRKLSTNK